MFRHRHALSAALLAIVASTSSLQGQRTVNLAYLHGADTIARESVTRTGTTWRGTLQMRGQPRISWEQSGGASPVFSMKVFAPTSTDDTEPLQSATFKLTGDTMQVDIAGGAAPQQQRIPTKAGARALLNTSLAHTVLLARTALAQGKESFDALLTMGGNTLGGTVRQSGDTIMLTLQGIEMNARVDADGYPVEIIVPSQGLRAVPVAAGGAAPAATPVNYDAPDGAPYVAEHVRIPTERGYQLAATLTRPLGTARVPVAITISGSGQQDRDSRISIVPSYASFREIADTLGKRGVAVLRFDDRGAGESNGAPTLVNATTASFADDVRSIVEWLRQRNDIDGNRIALIGHSEGGIIAPMVAASDANIRAVVLMAASAFDGRRILMYQNREAVQNAVAATQSQRDSIMATVPARIDSLAKQNPWIGFFVSYDPLPTARRVRQPTLILHGETDRQVTVEQADTLASAMRAAGNSSVTLHKFKDTNHLFLEDPSGAFGGYPSLKNQNVRKEVLGTLADWLVQQLK